MSGLGRNFTRLWAAATVSNIGDGWPSAVAMTVFTVLAWRPFGRWLAPSGKRTAESEVTPAAGR
ncbi:hypothetical protein [Nonomuraea roseola]|uniref:MFS transporter n=1 Tax=Nonomuraea roseola TaxID=46179 RepID=A0ABV5Q1G5_9ACTN